MEVRDEKDANQLAGPRVAHQRGAGSSLLRAAGVAGEQVNGHQDTRSGHALGDSNTASRDQADDVTESLVTQAENSLVATAKRPPRKPKRVTSDSQRVKAEKAKVLPFQQRTVSHVRQKEKAEWEIKECGCRLPKMAKREWRDFENGHRLLAVVGYGKSKNNKRVKKRDCVRYYTHEAMKEFLEGDYGRSQTYNAAKA